MENSFRRCRLDRNKLTRIGGRASGVEIPNAGTIVDRLRA